MHTNTSNARLRENGFGYARVQRAHEEQRQMAEGGSTGRRE